MAKQWTELEKMVIPGGRRQSNAISLHPRTGTVATITIYVPWGPKALLYVSADGEEFVQFMYRDRKIELTAQSACDVPLPACKSMRVEAEPWEGGDRVFQVLALLEVD